MKIIVVGVGKLGEYLSRNLVRDGNEVTLIDVDFSDAKELINNEDVNYICGNALDSNVLKEAGAKNCDLIICVTDSDENNIICAMLARKLGTKNSIARIRNVEYTSSINLLKNDLGLSMIVNPEQDTATQIARALSIPSALEATSFLKGRLQMITVKVKEKSALDNFVITNFNKKQNLNIIVCAVERAGVTIVPTGKFKLKAGDKISVAGKVKEISEFLTFADLNDESTKKVIIAGGGRTSMYLSKSLLDMGMKVKIIEIDPERCKVLSEKLPGALIINADVSDKDILFEEGINEADAFVALTNIDEENIVYSMFASIQSVPKIITKVNHMDLPGVVEKTNIDMIITPHRIATNHIVKYVRAMNNSSKSSCEAIYKLDDVFEMQEFNVKEDFKGIGIKIKDMPLKDNILIVAIQRGKNTIVPNGNDEIELNDTVVIIDGSGLLKELNDILE